MARKTLQILGEKALDQAVEPDLVAYCPSMDLVAIGTSDQQIQLFRTNGQRIYSVLLKGSTVRAEKIAWKASGQFLAVAWSDGIVRLVSAESSKTVHQVQVSDGSEHSITCLSWSSNSSSKGSVARQKQTNTSWSDVLYTHHDVKPLDLPRDLTLIDIEESLPKLSTIPSGGTTDDVFSTKASLDSIFSTYDPKGNDTVDVLVVGTSDGKLHLSIYDSFFVGSFPLPTASSADRKSTARLVSHSANSSYSTHALLAENDGKLCCIPMDLRFVSASSGYLSLLASKSTTLHNLLRYINQLQGLITAEWKSTQDLPSRFLANVDETLAEKDQMNIVQAMYHSVATGHTLPAVREWLVDELAERGHKRWDKAVSSGLENIRKLIHENMLPALERCSVILSRLSGIAKYQGVYETTGYSSHQISLVMDTIVCLNLVSGRILTIVVEEIDLFASFSSWLRHEIDRLASAGSSNPDDLLEKESAIEHSKVLKYIHSSIIQSPLTAYFQDVTPEEYKRDWEVAEQGLPLFDLLDKQLQNYEAGQPYLKALTRVEFLCNHLDRQANNVFQQIAEAEKRNVLLGEVIELEFASKGTLSTMTVCPKTEHHCTVFIALALPGESTIQIEKIELGITSGISKVISVENATFSLQNGAIIDIAFLDECILLLLCKAKNSIQSIIPVWYRADGDLTYFPGTTSPHGVAPILKGSAMPYQLAENRGFEATSLEVRHREHVSEYPPRICLVDKRRPAYMILGLSEDGTGWAAADDDISMS